MSDAPVDDPIAVPPQPMRHTPMTEAAAAIEVIGDEALAASLPSAARMIRAMADALRLNRDVERERRAFMKSAARMNYVASLWKRAVMALRGLDAPPADGTHFVTVRAERSEGSMVSWRQASMWLHRVGWRCAFGHLWQNSREGDARVAVYVPPDASTVMLSGAIAEAAKAEGLPVSKVLAEMAAIYVPEDDPDAVPGDGEVDASDIE